MYIIHFGVIDEFSFFHGLDTSIIDKKRKTIPSISAILNGSRRTTTPYIRGTATEHDIIRDVRDNGPCFMAKIVHT